MNCLYIFLIPENTFQRAFFDYKIIFFVNSQHASTNSRSFFVIRKSVLNAGFKYIWFTNTNHTKKSCWDKIFCSKKKTSDSVYQKVSVIIYTLYVIVEYKVEMNIPHLYKHYLTDK